MLSCRSLSAERKQCDRSCQVITHIYYPSLCRGEHLLERDLKLSCESWTNEGQLAMVAQRIEQQAKCFIQEGRSESTCIQRIIEILIGAPHNTLRPSSIYQINAYGLCFHRQYCWMMIPSAHTDICCVTMSTTLLSIDVPLHTQTMAGR